MQWTAHPRVHSAVADARRDLLFPEEPARDALHSRCAIAANRCRTVPSSEADCSDPNERLRIAQVAPLYESVPPQLYGGTERVVSWLTEELVGLGHDVTLFASGDSQTSGHLVPVCPDIALARSGCRGRHCLSMFACWNWSFAICRGLM